MTFRDEVQSIIFREKESLRLFFGRCNNEVTMLWILLVQDMTLNQNMEDRR
jgi:hypothetical protein